MEAFESHVRQRHGHRAATVRHNELHKVEGKIKRCQVNMDKKSSSENYNPKTLLISNSGETVSATGILAYKREASENLSASSSMSSSSSSSIQSFPPPQRPPSSRSKTPTPDKELFLPSSNSSSSSNSASSTPVGQMMSSGSMSSSSHPLKNTDSTMSGVLDMEQPMDIDDIESSRQSSLETLVSRSIAKAAAEVAAAQTASGRKPKFTSASEEADSTTPNNVISIPDTEPLPHAMSGDLMAMVGEASAADSTTTISSNTMCEQTGLIKSNQPLSIKLNSRTDSIVLSTGGIPPNSSSNLSLKSSLPSNLVSNLSNIAGLPPSTGSVPSPTRLKTLVPSNISSPVPSPATTKGSPTKKPPGAVVAGSGGNPSLMRSNSKLFREYHPDKHCGVWDSEAKRHCTRALTCKSHSVLLKRKISGRSKNFDELVVAHKKAQAAAQAAAKEQQEQQLVSSQHPAAPQTPPTVSVVVSGTQSAPQPIFGNNNAVLQPNNNIISVQPTITNIQQNTIQPTIVQHPMNINSMNRSTAASPPIRKVGGALLAKEVDENLHYTVDHPKPLAVCTFGGRRIGGLLVADRSQFLTRKLVRVAITAGGIARLGIGGGGPSGGNGVSPGFHKIRPRVGGINLGDSSQIGLMKGGGIIKRTQSAGISARNISCGSSVGSNNSGSVVGTGGNYLLNYNLSSNIKRQLSNVNVGATVNAGSVNLSTLQPGGHVTGSVPESFKTDIQDFKGGIKFELGRKIKHILPSGSEVSK